MPQRTEKHQLPALSLRAEFNSGSFNKEKRTVDLVWSTGAPVLRGFWEPFYEELSMDPKHVRMGRMEKGAPLLNTHGQYSLEDVLGVVDRGWLEDGQGKATVRFSEREDVAPFAKDVEQGIIRNVSVGYRVYKYEDTTPKPTMEVPNPTRVLRAVDWEPFEISLVPIPADADATVRAGGERIEKNEVIVELSARAQEEFIMPNKNETAPDASGAPINEEQIRKESKKAEAERQGEIRKMVRAVKLEEVFADELCADSELTLDGARAKVIDKVASRAEAAAPAARPTNPDVTIVRDETVQHREALTEAILHRVNPSKNKLTEVGKSYAHLRLLEMYREHARLKGLDLRGMGPMQLAERAFHSTSDFANILADTINKSLRAQYESSPKTFQPFCRQGSAPDFKNMSKVQLSDFPTLTKVNEHGEFKMYSMSDGKEQYALSTYGARVGLTRQALINDDLSAFDRIPGMVGGSAADLESDIVWGIITANAALADTGLLFNATALSTAGGHANLTSTGTAISVDSLGIGKAAMRKQLSLQGRPLNIIPEFLIVNAAKETLAQQFTSNMYVASESGKINPFASQLKLIVEPRLDAASATAWYLAASPGRVDTIEYSYLEGAAGVYTETRMGFEVDGMEIKVRHDFAAKALDFRGLYKNNGA